MAAGLERPPLLRCCGFGVVVLSMRRRAVDGADRRAGAHRCYRAGGRPASRTPRVPASEGMRGDGEQQATGGQASGA